MAKDRCFENRIELSNPGHYKNQEFAGPRFSKNGCLMTSFRPLTVCALMVLLCFSWTGAARASAHVYLLRGIFNVSVGLDALAAKLARQGIAATVYGHDEGGTVAALAAQQYSSGAARPIVLIGHSLGAGAAVTVAQQLNNAGIPVALLVLLDPVSSQAVPPNVGRAVNLYVSGGQGTQVGAAPGFRGSLSNLDYRSAGMDHMSIQAADSVHSQIIGYIHGVGAGGGAARGGAPHGGASHVAKAATHHGRAKGGHHQG
jgi:pimeloyl-ACP methyl ester carboxylesterase